MLPLITISILWRWYKHQDKLEEIPVSTYSLSIFKIISYVITGFAKGPSNVEQWQMKGLSGLRWRFVFEQRVVLIMAKITRQPARARVAIRIEP